MNWFCSMVDRRKAFSLISSRDHRRRSSSSRISDTSRARFEPVQNLSSGWAEWSRAVVITSKPRRHQNRSKAQSDLNRETSNSWCEVLPGCTAFHKSQLWCLKTTWSWLYLKCKLYHQLLQSSYNHLSQGIQEWTK